MLYRLKAFDTIKRGISFKEPTADDFPEVNFKYGELGYVLNHTTYYVRQIINACPINGNYKYIVVDVKVHDLKAGQLPALPFWHMDGTNKPLDNRTPDLNHIFVSGNFCLTQFLKNEKDIDIPIDIPANFDRILKNETSVSIEGNTIYSYERHVHRAVKSTSEGKRLLIRVTETNYTKPCNKPFSVTYSE